MNAEQKKSHLLDTDTILFNAKFLLVTVWSLSLLFDFLGRYDIGLWLWVVFIPLSLIVAVMLGLRRWGRVRLLACLLAVVLPFGFICSQDKEAVECVDSE